MLTIMSTNVSNDKNASVQHQTRNTTTLFRICYDIHWKPSLRTIEIKER